MVFSITCVRHAAQHGPSDSASTRSAHIMFAYPWRESYAIGWALHYKRMPCPTPVLLSATQVLKISLNQNIFLDMASPSPMSGWPEHMHVDKDGKGDIRCLAMGCTHTFKTDEKVQLEMVKHYDEEMAKSVDNTMHFIHHRILKQMLYLRICLICQADFKLPDSKLPDSRALFKHNKAYHPDQKDVSTIQGFITQVRKFPNGRAVASDKEKKFWEKTLRIAYRYMECTLKQEPGDLWYDFNKFLGYRDTAISAEELREFLTSNPTKHLSNHPGQVLSFEVAQYLPIHPELFLCDLKYVMEGSFLLEEEWLALRNKFQDLYREGSM